MFSFHPQKIGAPSKGNDNYNEDYDNDLFWYSSLIIECRESKQTTKKNKFMMFIQNMCFSLPFTQDWSRLFDTNNIYIMWGIFIIIFDKSSIHFNELEDMY